MVEMIDVSVSITEALWMLHYSNNVVFIVKNVIEIDCIIIMGISKGK